MPCSTNTSFISCARTIKNSTRPSTRRARLPAAASGLGYWIFFLSCRSTPLLTAAERQVFGERRKYGTLAYDVYCTLYLGMPDGEQSADCLCRTPYTAMPLTERQRNRHCHHV